MKDLESLHKANEERAEVLIRVFREEKEAQKERDKQRRLGRKLKREMRDGKRA